MKHAFVVDKFEKEGHTTRENSGVIRMRVVVYSDNGEALFSTRVGSARKCDTNTCYPAEVKEALKLATQHGDLPKWHDLTARRFYTRRQRARTA